MRSHFVLVAAFSATTMLSGAAPAAAGSVAAAPGADIPDMREFAAPPADLLLARWGDGNGRDGRGRGDGGPRSGRRDGPGDADRGRGGRRDEGRRGDRVQAERQGGGARAPRVGAAPSPERAPRARFSPRRDGSWPDARSDRGGRGRGVDRPAVVEREFRGERRRYDGGGRDNRSFRGERRRYDDRRFSRHYDHRRHGPRHRDRRPDFPYYYLGWWYAAPWWSYDARLADDYCAYWDERCEYLWGWRTHLYYRCLRDQDCW